MPPIIPLPVDPARDAALRAAFEARDGQAVLFLFALAGAIALVGLIRGARRLRRLA